MVRIEVSFIRMLVIVVNCSLKADDIIRDIFSDFTKLLQNHRRHSRTVFRG